MQNWWSCQRSDKTFREEYNRNINEIFKKSKRRSIMAIQLYLIELLNKKLIEKYQEN